MKDNKFITISIDPKEVHKTIDNFMQILEENNLAVQEISIDLYNMKTKKNSKIDLFKSFAEWIDERSKEEKVK